MSKRILLSVDVSNLYYCTKMTFGGLLVDYAKLMRKAQSLGVIHRAIAYGAQVGESSLRFIDALHNLGFETKYKEPKVFIDGSRKADWDMGIAMDVVRILDQVDIVVIASADGDLVDLVKWVQEQGRQCYVIGCNISRDLRDFADRWFEIDSSLLINGERNELVPCRSSEQSEALPVGEEKSSDCVSGPVQVESDPTN